MKKNILIISSDFTGHGHKSITESLKEQFAAHSNVKVHVVDGFSLGGNVLFRIGKLYGSVTRNAKDIWKMVWEISFKRPAVIDEFIEMIIKENFLRLLANTRPDLILSVHTNYNGSIINIMKEYNINIPFVTLTAFNILVFLHKTPILCLCAYPGFPSSCPGSAPVITSGVLQATASIIVFGLPLVKARSEATIKSCMFSTKP